MKLLRIEHNRSITEELDYNFIFQLENFLLLALREQEILTTMQHRRAEEKLQKIRRERAKKLSQKDLQL